MTSPFDAPESKKNWSQSALQAFLHYGGSALALYLLFHFLPGWQVWGALRTLPTRLWLGVLAGYLGAHCIGIAKWCRMVNLAGAGLNVTQAARCYFAGFSARFFSPRSLEAMWSARGWHCLWAATMRGYCGEVFSTGLWISWHWRSSP